MKTTAEELDRKLTRLAKLLKKPRSVEQIREITGGGERSVYRWISLLSERKGLVVIRVPGRAGVFQVIT